MRNYPAGISSLAVQFSRMIDLTSTPVGVRNIAIIHCDCRPMCVCLSVYLSVRSHIPKTTHPNFISPNFLYMLSLAVAPSLSDGNSILYVLLAVWKTTCFHIMNRTGQNRRRHVCFVQYARWRHRGRTFAVSDSILKWCLILIENTSRNKAN